jgi:acetyltransferase-like isoleucine patch superfamily enzyme
VVAYGVIVQDGAWIGSTSLLMGCTIGAGAIVAAGSVVRGQVIEPGIMVAGNPARVIARWDGTRWNYLPSEQSGFQRELA